VVVGCNTKSSSKDTAMRFTSISALILFFSSLLLGCRSDRSKKAYDSTTPVCGNNLFVETFTIFGVGAFGGDRVSEYLTDSTHFRMYIGTFDNAHGGYSYQCYDDSIKISKVVDDTAAHRIVSSVRIYSISELRKSNEFD